MSGLMAFDGAAIRRWNREARESLRDSEHFVVARIHGFRAYHRRTVQAEELCAVLLADPDRFLEEGELLAGRGNSCRIARVEIAGNAYVLKRYDRRGWVYSFRHVFKRSRALRTWLVAWNLRIRGFSVAEPMVCFEERNWRFLGRSYILSEHLEGRQTLTTFWATLTPPEKTQLVAQAAAMLGTLHRAACIHGDTNWDNLLVRRDEEGFAFSLVDFDCARILAKPDPRRARRDIGHFLRDLDRLEPSAGDLKPLFIERWQRAGGFTGA